MNKNFIQTVDTLSLLRQLQYIINYIIKKFYCTTSTEIDEENVFEAKDNRYF
jgi:hypothetical protein